MQQAVSIAQRRFTSPSQDVYDTVEWQTTNAVIGNHTDGTTTFQAEGVEFPVGWSQNAINIVSQKYFKSGETSLRQLIDRVANTIAAWGLEDGYFYDADSGCDFQAELKWLLLHQHMAFNSPVWFNIGVPGVPQQASACFILDVEDDMRSILEWLVEEGTIFKGGSGSGVNLSKLRGSMEKIRGQGEASGPLSFMRGADASAGAIKSGGATRRSAKMVQLDIDHPDIEDFITCKAREEGKIRALAAAGYDMGVNGADLASVQFQNANNSVRVTDAFMQAVVDDESWDLTSRVNGQTVRTVQARELMQLIAQAAWECADPGIMFHDTINKMHTMPSQGEIVASNPCGEYNHLVNSACNLASINLLKFLGDDGYFDYRGFLHAVRVTVLAQDILVGRADYPTEKIAANARAQRQLGVGYSNLGALLMAMGHPYDSEEGRLVTSAITSLMTVEAYLTSVQLAQLLGPFEGYQEDAKVVRRVMEEHRSATERLARSRSKSTVEMIDVAHGRWRHVLRLSEAYGVRNAQLSLLAPTGTISFLMDCDTTGAEPAFNLAYEKTLAGGGKLHIVNQGVPRALASLGYSPEHTDEIMAFLEEHHTVVGAPHFKTEHESVFDCANDISPLGHLQMMAAMQPFLSGAISKTVNLPASATVDEVYDLYLQAWQLGIKALAIYRDGCKAAQPHQAKKQAAQEIPDLLARALPLPLQPAREELPRERSGRTVRFHLGEAKGYVTVGEYDDGRLGEVFVKMAKQGSTLAGLLDAHAANLSISLQYGVPLVSLLKPLVGMSFEPAGITDDPEIRMAKSIWDYIGKWLALHYLASDEREELGVYSREERIAQAQEESQPPAHASSGSAPMCNSCGVLMQRAGACHCCPSCGTTDGCS